MNYTFENLKQQLENERDKFLEDSDNLSGFDQSVDRWWKQSCVEFEIEFDECTAVLTIDILIEMNRDGEILSGDFEISKGHLQYEVELETISEQDLIELEKHINF